LPGFFFQPDGFTEKSNTNKKEGETMKKAPLLAFLIATWFVTAGVASAQPVTLFEATLSPTCEDGSIDPGEECGEPGLSCPPEAPICIDCKCILAVELLYFVATAGDGAVDVRWETASEVDTAGFNLHRSTLEVGPYTLINPEFFAARGGPTSGALYVYTDVDVENGTTYWYKLEDVDTQGYSTFYGPVSATPNPREPWTIASNAEASIIDGGNASSSNSFNAFGMLLAPIGVVLILRFKLRR
jgi:hypothetical protein